MVLKMQKTSIECSFSPFFNPYQILCTVKVKLDVDLTSLGDQRLEIEYMFSSL